MRINKSLFALTLCMLLLLFGCSNDTNSESVIASEKTLPSNFREIAFERKTSPYSKFLVRKAINQSEFEQVRNLYGLESEIPNIDFNDKDVFFIGVEESGSCPYKINNVRSRSDNTTITVTLSNPEESCRADATPRTFVIQTDKEISKDIENVVIVQSGILTEIPFDN